MSTLLPPECSYAQLLFTRASRTDQSEQSMMSIDQSEESMTAGMLSPALSPGLESQSVGSGETETL